MKKLLIFLALMTFALTSIAIAKDYDLVIKNGRVMDPETNFDAVANVAVEEGKIIKITSDRIAGEQEIDAPGMPIRRAVGDKMESVRCPEVRPEICTMDYNPVCGHLADGSLKTYANGCGACSDPNVDSYTTGECK